MNEMNPYDEYEEKPERGDKDIPWDKLLGVALLGAIGSALLYYIFIQLGEEQKQAVKETVLNTIKSAVAKTARPEIE